MTFESLGLAAPLLRAVEALGYTSPTPVQIQAIPGAMQGGDLMVSSQTGSGKTAAFLLPMLHLIISAQQPEAVDAEGTTTAATAAPSKKSGKNKSSKGFSRGPATPSLLVLCPTRELAEQVTADAINLVKFTKGIRVAMVIGGMPYGKQMEALQGANIVIATPGRLLDLENKNNIRLNQVRALVVDEADRMLDLGFAEDLEAIHDLTAQREQTMMFSATFEGRIMKLAANVMRDPAMITVGSAQEKHQDITQTLHWADSLDHKKKILDHWLREVAVEQAVVFVSTQIDSESLAEELLAQGHSVVAMHGAMPQFIRQRRLKGLREGKTRVLVATDVAARGLDVPSISHVFNYGLPMKVEDYVHRIGRTGRAGRSGVAVTLADHRERFKIKDIERYTRQPIQAVAIPGLEPKLSSESRNGNGKRGQFDRKPSGGAGRSSFAKDRSAREPRGDFGSKPREYSRDSADRSRFQAAPPAPAYAPAFERKGKRAAAAEFVPTLGGKTFGQPEAPARTFADRGFAPRGEGQFARKPAQKQFAPRQEEGSGSGAPFGTPKRGASFGARGDGFAAKKWAGAGQDGAAGKFAGAPKFAGAAKFAGASKFSAPNKFAGPARSPGGDKVVAGHFGGAPAASPKRGDFAAKRAAGAGKTGRFGGFRGAGVR
jgi:superfamily II DNA/RNA helicase